jgi:ABC-type nitrate/sulfonate/bicarbonate transport system substrate-binding protein
MNRRSFTFLATSVISSEILRAPLRAFGESRFTEWGWPQPYTQVSASSQKWLESQGWWPLKLGSQPGFTGMPVAIQKSFYKARGLELETIPFFSGPAINEAVVAGRVQGGLAGNFPFTSLIALEFPVRCLAVLAPNIKHAALVPLDSPLQTIEDLKKQSDKPAFGIVTGSSAEFFFNEALRTTGMEPGKDVILKNMGPPDMLTLPSGLTGVVQWAPWAWDHLLFRKNARQLFSIFPYNFYMGNLYLRQEILDKAPDIAQAVVDGFAEGVLYTRYKPGDAIRLTHNDVMHARFSPEMLERLIKIVNNQYRPTWFYPHTEFWSTENARVAKWLYETKRLQKLITADRYAAVFDVRFADHTFETLGWKRPDRPPFIPPNWPGRVGQVPYPEYVNEDTYNGPQPFGEPGDLIRPWYFDGRLHAA